MEPRVGVFHRAVSRVERGADNICPLLGFSLRHGIREAVSVNKELDRLQVSIHKVYESLSGKSDAPITAERVRELVFGLNSESQGLLYHTNEYIDRFRERVGIDRSERRLKCLLLFRKHLANFVRYRYRVLQ